MLFSESGDTEVFKADRSRLFASNKKANWQSNLNAWLASLIPVSSGREINFFSDSHLAPKLFKVVANLKKSVTIYKDRQNLFLMLSAF